MKLTWHEFQALWMKHTDDPPHPGMFFVRSMRKDQVKALLAELQIEVEPMKIKGESASYIVIDDVALNEFAERTPVFSMTIHWWERWLLWPVMDLMKRFNPVQRRKHDDHSSQD